MSLNDEDSKNKILDFFYSHTKKEDWIEGIDLYQLKRIENVTKYHSLFTAEISSFSNKTYEVRLRIREHTNLLQWIECSCHKNRKHSVYCEHIVAFILYLNKKEAKLFSKLNTVSSSFDKFKNIKQSFSKLLAKEETKANTGNHLTASHSLLSHIKGEIKKVSYNNKGIFELEIVDALNTTSYHTLSIDSLVNYLKTKKTKAHPFKAKNFLIHDDQVSIGLKIYEDQAGKLIVEKNATYEKQDDDVSKHSPFIELNDSHETLQNNLEFLPFDKNCHLDKKYFYHKKNGFFPIKNSTVTSSLKNQAAKRELSEDKIPSFFENEYEILQKKYILWISNDLKRKNQVSHATLNDVKILKEKKGWFYLDPKYEMDGQIISMVTLIDSYQNKKRKYHKTSTGWLKIPEFIKDNTWQLSHDNKTLTTNKLGLLRLEALSGKFDGLVGSKMTLDYGKDTNLNKLTKTPINATNTKLVLRPYQKEGLNWLCWLYNNDLHGLLADDMGLGKTHQAMGLLSLVQEENKTKPCYFLVVCPTSVIDHWHSKVKTYSPQLNPQKHHGIKRSFLLENKRIKTTTLLTSYGILLRDYKKLAERKWDVIVLDEAHYIKNHKTMTYKAVCLIQSNFRLCLTGTPMENHLGELKNLFDFLVPGYLGSTHFFNKEFMIPIIQNHDIEKENTLQKLIYPLKLRRTKQEVLKDLPNKVEDIRYCRLSNEQSSLYQNALKKRAQPLLEKIESEKSIPYLHVFTLLQLLKQICNHPALIYKTNDFQNHESGKFELLKDILREAIDSKQKIVIFSQYLGMIKYIETYCTQEKIKSVCLTGASQNRGNLIAKFQEDPNIQVFIGSLLAGGTGIDLTAASVVIHYDRWWNPSKENQATDRVHRIGQKKSVQVFKLVTKGTLEEKIDELINKKAEDFNKFFEQDKTIFRSLSKEDIINLLS